MLSIWNPGNVRWWSTPIFGSKRLLQHSGMISNIDLDKILVRSFFFLMKWMFNVYVSWSGLYLSRSLLVNTKKYLNFPSVSRKHLRTVQTSAIVPAMKSHSIIPAGCCMRSWALTRDWRWIYSGRTLASGAKGRTSWLGLMEPATPFCHPRSCVHLVSR